MTERTHRWIDRALDCGAWSALAIIVVAIIETLVLH